VLSPLLPEVDQAEQDENEDDGHHDSEQAVDREDHCANLPRPALLRITRSLA
jgi:hypothetical protein